MLEHPQPELDTTTIVLLGSFNPRIFQPAWFVAQGLLPTEEATAGNIHFINNDFCAFETDWFHLEVLSDRLTLSSRAAPIVETLRDLLIGTFRVLRHTPVQKMGLNTHAHFPLPNEQLWHRFGHMCAPKDELWSPILRNPGTRSLMIESERPDQYEGHLNVKVEPSLTIANGVFIETNDEFRRLGSDSAAWAVELLEDEWDNYRRRATGIRAHLLAKALESS